MFRSTHRLAYSLARGAARGTKARCRHPFVCLCLLTKFGLVAQARDDFSPHTFIIEAV